MARTRVAVRPRSVAVMGLSTPLAAFLGGSLISKLGDALYTFALPWIAFELTRSPVILGTLYATEIVPILLFGAVAGVYVDRWNRRTLLLMADLLRAALVALIPLLHMLGALQIWHCYVIVFSLALVSLAGDVATTATIPALAAGELTRANAGYQLIGQVAELAGPTLAGVMIAAIGGFQTLWLDVVSFAGTFLVIRRLTMLKQRETRSAQGSVWRGMAEGFRWLWNSPVIKVLSLQAMIGNFGFGMVSAVLLYYLRAVLGLNPQLSGLDYALLGVGGLVGSLAVMPLEGRFRKGSLYPLILLFGMVGLLVMVVAPWWWAPGLGFGMVAACNVAWVVMSTSVRQELIPQQLIGRVLSFSRLLSTAAMPLGATVAALITRSMDPRVVFLIAAACKGMEALIARFSPMRNL